MYILIVYIIYIPRLTIDQISWLVHAEERQAAHEAALGAEVPDLTNKKGEFMGFRADVWWQGLALKKFG